MFETVNAPNLDNLNSMTVAGSWNGDLRNPNGVVVDLFVGGLLGNASSQGNPDDFRAIRWDDLNCGGMQGARFDAGANTQADFGSVVIRGDIDDTRMLVRNLTGDIRIIGDMRDSEIIFENAPASGPPTQTTPAAALLGGSLGASSVLQFPTLGLTRDIIINAVNATGTWEGDVIVGSNTLQRAYSIPNSTLGGGSIGQVPFQNHDADCIPAGGSLVVSPADVDQDVTLVHYGRILATVSTTETLIFERRRMGLTAWESLDITRCNGIITSITAAPGTDDRGILIEFAEDLPPGWEYRVRPNASAPANLELKSVVDGTAVAGIDDELSYTFSVGVNANTYCEADFDADGDVDLGDFGRFGSEFGIDPTTLGCLIVGDFNNDGDVDLGTSV